MKAKITREIAGLALLAAACIAIEAAIRGSLPPPAFILPVIAVFTIVAAGAVVSALRSARRDLVQPGPR